MTTKPRHNTPRENAAIDRVISEDIARHENELAGERAARDAVAGDDVDEPACVTDSDRRGAVTSGRSIPEQLRTALERATEEINRVELQQRVTGRACGFGPAIDLATLRILAQAAHRDLTRFEPAVRLVTT